MRFVRGFLGQPKKAISYKLRILSTVSYGALFGEIAFLQPQPRSATAVAVEATELLVFNKPDVQKLIDLYPTLAATFYHAVAIELANRLTVTTPRIT
jgi:CRP-like cAMP-binding protein